MADIDWSRTKHELNDEEGGFGIDTEIEVNGEVTSISRYVPSKVTFCACDDPEFWIRIGSAGLH